MRFVRSLGVAFMVVVLAEGCEGAGEGASSADTMGPTGDVSAAVDTHYAGDPSTDTNMMDDANVPPEVEVEPEGDVARIDGLDQDALIPEVAEPEDIAPLDVGPTEVSGADVVLIDTPAADAGSADVMPTDANLNAPDVCEPSCGDHECDDDGCGGSCGTCPTWAPTCIDGYCEGGDDCTPECDATFECGDDGCDGSCGHCPKGSYCNLHTCEQGTECAALSKCSTGCEGDDSCLDACYSNASFDGLDVLTNLQLCLLGSCFGSANYLACVAGSCLDEYTTCFAGTLGTGTCGALRSCGAGCKADTSCANACMSEAKLEAVGLYLNYLGCLDNACPSGSPVSCFGAALTGVCKPPLDACNAQI